MSFKPSLSASVIILALLTIASDANAQTIETTSKSVWDCSHTRDNKKLGVLSDLADLEKQVTDKRRKKYALKAAKKALEAGYNYAYMEPLAKTDSRRKAYGDDWWNGPGSGLGFKVGAKGRTLKCTAIDDIVAFQTIMEKNAAASTSIDTGGFVNLRLLYETFEGQPYKTAQKPQISSQHFKSVVGVRERIAQQYPVMMAAMACNARLRPTSIRDFSYTPSSDAEISETRCLSNLRPKAQSVGLDFTKLILSDADDLGYYVNTPTQPSAVSVTPGGRQGLMADPAKWGNDWYDYSAQFPNLDGKALIDYDISNPNEANRTYILLTSNTLSKNDLIPYAVFLSAKNGMNSKNQKNNVAVLEDRSPDPSVKRSPSASTTPGEKTSKGLSYGTESYKTVVYIFAGNYTGCIKGKDICADKLKAYNTLGERLNVRGFTPLSTPKNYRPYTPR